MDELVVQDVPSYFFSLEMSGGQFWQRQLAKHTGVSSARMTKGTLTQGDWKKIDGWVQDINDKDSYPVFVDEWSLKIDNIYETAGRLIHKYGKGVIFVDYLQLVQKEGNEQEYQAVSRIVTALKLLAKALEVPVVALAQLNRSASDTDSESQSLDSWLRGSGQIEQDADVILFLLGERGPGIVERTVVIQKDRHGTAGIRFSLDFNQPLMQFGERGHWALDFGNDVQFDNDAPTVTPDDHDLFGASAEILPAFLQPPLPAKVYEMKSTPIGPVAVPIEDEGPENEEEDAPPADKWNVPFKDINKPIGAKKASFTF
jgi:replicative DNA helicase